MTLPAMAKPLSPSALAWKREHAALWSARANELRSAGGTLNNNKAAALDLVVRGLLAAISDETAPGAPPHSADGKLALLEARLAVCEPCPYPGTNIMLGVGPIMDAVRLRLRAEIAALRGEPLDNEPPVTSTIEVMPPPAAVPFTVGPQLDLFGIAA